MRSRFTLYVLSILLACWFASPALAQSQVAFSAQVDKTSLSAADTLVLTLTVEGDLQQLPKPELPLLAGFAVVGSSSSTHFSMVNGAVTLRGEFTYWLQPTEVGTHTIGPATIQVEGITYQTDPITVEVVAGQTPTQAAPSPTSPAPSGAQGKKLFVEAAVDNLEPVVGQQIIYRFRFYRALSVDLFEQPLADWPSFSGFWWQDLSPNRQYYQDIGPDTYRVIEVRWALFPTSAGQITIEPAGLTIPASFFNSGQELHTEPIVVNVQALPESAPPDFGGAVGRYEMSARLEPNEARVNEPVTLLVRVTGSGNLNSLPEPAWPELPDWRVYDPQITTNLSQTDDAIQGERLYERLLVPKAPGDYAIPAFSLSYYDPIAGAYRRAETAPLTIHVEPGEGSGSSPPPGENGKQEVTLLASDIRHIKAAPPTLAATRRSLLSQPLYWLGWAVPPLAVLGVWLWERQRSRLRGDVAHARAQRAQRLARKRLAEARRLAKGPGAEPEGMYAATSRALTGYLGDKFNLPPAGLTRDAIRQSLTRAGVTEDLIARLFDCLDWADSGRFAPAAAGRGAGELLAEAESVVAQLEQPLHNVSDRR